jgi:hypothetical protein
MLSLRLWRSSPRAPCPRHPRSGRSLTPSPSTSALTRMSLRPCSTPTILVMGAEGLVTAAMVTTRGASLLGDAAVDASAAAQTTTRCLLRGKLKAWPWICCLGRYRRALRPQPPVYGPCRIGPPLCSDPVQYATNGGTDGDTTLDTPPTTLVPDPTTASTTPASTAPGAYPTTPTPGGAAHPVCRNQDATRTAPSFEGSEVPIPHSGASPATEEDSLSGNSRASPSSASATGMDGSVDRSEELAWEETVLQPKVEPVSPVAMTTPHAISTQVELASQVEETRAQDLQGQILLGHMRRPLWPPRRQASSSPRRWLCAAFLDNTRAHSKHSHGRHHGH